MQWVVDLSQLKATEKADIKLSVSLQSDSSNAYLRLDNIFFTPLKSAFKASVYDETKLRTTALVSANGNSGRTIYNLFYGTASTIGSFGNPLSITTQFNTRQTTNMTTQPFPQAQPNCRVAVNGRGHGFYDDFKADALDNYNFINSQASDWSVANDQLQLQQTSQKNPFGAQLQRHNFQADSLAIYVQVEGDTTQTVSMGTDDYVVQWDGSQSEWQLYQKIGANYTLVTSSATVGWQQEWLLAVFESRLFFFANGVCLFNYQSDAISQSSHNVLLGGKQAGIGFKQLIVAEDVQLNFTYLDGKGRTLQSLAVEAADTVILSTGLYDALERQAISIKPARVTTQQVTNPFAYYLHYVTNGGINGDVWSGKPMKGPVVDLYHLDDGGYPFSRTTYEASPLSRPLQKGLPGKDFAITQEGNPHITTYAYGVNDGTETFLYPLPKGKYYTTTTQDADGNQAIQYRDTADHAIGNYLKPPAGKAGNIIQSSQVYDAAGQRIAAIPPSYYQENTNPQTSMLPAQASTYTYDFLGYLIHSYVPDQGDNEFIYDNAGRMRFMRDARGQADSFFNYLKYDAMGRLVEKGVCTDTWNESTLQQKANEPTWPTENTTWSNRYYYDGDEQTSNMVGNLWYSEVNNNGGDTADVQDTYMYDRLGRTLSLTQAITTNAGITKDTLAYTYQIAGNLLTSTDSATELTTTYSYNLLGQIDTVTGTQGSTTTKLASYQYLPSGAIDTLILMPDTTAFTRQYQYLPNDWPTSVQDKAIQETLQYTQEACDGTGYYNGANAHETVQYKQGQAITSAQCFTIDHLNRLTTANTDEKKQSWQLDDNGNFTTHQVNDTTYTYHLKSPTNQLQSINSNDGQFERQYGYTANGQIDAIQMGSTTLLSLDYNRWNGLPESMTNDQGQTLSFTYNPDNLRVVKQVHQGQTQVSQTRYVIGLSGLPVVEVDETSTQSDTKRLIGLPGATLIYYATNQQYYWALTDHLGSTRAVVDQTGRTVAQYDYDVYGVPTIVQEPPFAYDYLFTGQYYDQEVGLYNYHARFYDPTIARFLMVDPALQGFNPYSYVGDMPESFTDPSGEIFGIDDFLIALAISAAIGAAIGAGVGGATYGISTAASGGKFDTGDFFKSMGIGAAAGAVGGAVGFGVGTGITAGLAAAGIEGGVLAGAATGAVSGAAGGVTGQVTANAISGQSLDTGLWQAALAGGVLGGLAGGYAGYKGSSSAGANASAEQGGSRPWPWLFRSLRGVQPQIRRFIGPATAEQAAGRDITVFSGHGSLRKVGAFFAPRFTVPEGTTLSVYSRPGYTISNSFGNAIETNTTSAISNARTRYFGGLREGPVERITYGPGASVPNYTLHPPHDLDVVQIPGGPTVQTVTSSTYLSELLKPNMGEVSWAACTSYERLFLPHFIPRRGSVILLN